MKTPLTEIDIETIILMAWADTIPFETISREYGLTANQVQKLMRTHQSHQTYVRWRHRVTSRTGSSSKHERLCSLTSTKTKW